MRRRKFIRDCSGATLQLRLTRFRSFLFPLMNVGIYFFEVHGARVDLFQHFGGLSLLGKRSQRGNIRFLSRERFKFLLLPGGFMYCPLARGFTRDRFNSANARVSPEPSDLRIRNRV